MRGWHWSCVVAPNTYYYLQISIYTIQIPGSHSPSLYTPPSLPQWWQKMTCKILGDAMPNQNPFPKTKTPIYPRTWWRSRCACTWGISAELTKRATWVGCAPCTLVLDNRSCVRQSHIGLCMFIFVLTIGFGSFRIHITPSTRTEGTTLSSLTSTSTSMTAWIMVVVAIEEGKQTLQEEEEEHDLLEEYYENWLKRLPPSIPRESQTPKEELKENMKCQPTRKKVEHAKRKKSIKTRMGKKATMRSKKRILGRCRFSSRFRFKQELNRQ